MSKLVYEIDPCADAVIVLKRPCRNFAPWKDTPTPSTTDSNETDKAERTGSRLPQDEDVNGRPFNAGIEAGEHIGASRSSDDTEIREQETVHDSQPLPIVGSEVSSSNMDPAESITQQTEPEDDEIHYLVSSRHLMLASPWFKRLLSTEEYAEGSKESDGLYHIPASEWDEQALLILLNIFHVRTRQVPATVSLEMLAKIAVLVDYYELENAEVIERDVKDWTAGVRLNAPIPESYCRDLILWIYVSQVFGMNQEFEKATALAITGSKDPIQTLGLPIRPKVTCSMDDIRCDALEGIMSELHNLREVYMDFNYSCPHNSEYSFQCGAMLFGALMKYTKWWGYLSPRPQKPFTGISLNTVCHRKDMKWRSTWWHAGSSFRGRRMADEHPCSLESKFEDIVQKAMADIKGLRMEDLPEIRCASSTV